MKKLIIFLMCFSLLFNFGLNLPQNESTGAISQTIEFKGNYNTGNPFSQCTSAIVANVSNWNTIYSLDNNSYIYNGADLFVTTGSTVTNQALVMRFRGTMPTQFTYYLSAYLNIYFCLANKSTDNNVKSYFYRKDGSVVSYYNRDFFTPVANSEYDGSWFDNDDVQYGIVSFTLPYDDIVRFEIRTKRQLVQSGTEKVNSFIKISYGSYMETQYELGYEDGFEAGEDKGYQDGFDAGYLEGGDNIALSFFNGAMKIIELIFSSLVQLLDTALVPGTPITMGLVFLGIPGAFMILGGVVNLVRRLLGG